MADVPASDVPSLSSEQLRILACLLDTIIPPAADGGLPGAGTAEVATHVDGVLRTLPDLRAMVVEGLAAVDEQARAAHGRPFVDLASSERDTIAATQSFVYAVMPHAFIGYYQQDAVLTGIGVDPRAPHPKGYEVPENDLTLLDPVRGRGKGYRDC